MDADRIGIITALPNVVLFVPIILGGPGNTELRTLGVENTGPSEDFFPNAQ
jgi:hypothetical protein